MMRLVIFVSIKVLVIVEIEILKRHQFSHYKISLPWSLPHNCHLSETEAKPAFNSEMNAYMAWLGIKFVRGQQQLSTGN